MSEANQMPVCEIRLDQYDPADVTIVRSDETLGIAIVGQAQAGKTTIRNIVTKVWKVYDEEGLALPFTASDGFRGLACHAVESMGHNLENEVAKDTFSEHLEAFIEQIELTSLIDDLYLNPLSEERLRNPAVNSIVTVIGEHARLRPLIHAAGGKFLGKQLSEPAKYGLREKPNLVILDARNHEECQDKFSHAGIRHIGTIIMTCPEDVIARRKLGAEASAADVEDVTNRLRQRNYDDRNRAIGRMTLPEDLSRVYNIADMINAKVTPRTIVQAGIEVASDPQIGIVIPTNEVTVPQEERVVELLLNGMLVG